MSTSSARKRNRARMARATERHHYTDRTSVPVRSSAETHDPGNVAGTWKLNTSTQVTKGGISSYYRSRERGYSA